MFKRREKQPFFIRLREFLWPSSGWRRAVSYLHHRIARIDGTPYAIAAGFASGASISFTPFVGLHFIIAGIVAWIIRGNIFTSALGTAVGNPWTFPFIWAATYNLGIKIVGGQASDDIMHNMDEMFSSFTIVDLVSEPIKALGPFLETIFVPMLTGGIVLGGALWVVFYWPIFKLVSKYKINRLKRRQRKLEARKNDY